MAMAGTVTVHGVIESKNPAVRAGGGGREIRERSCSHELQWCPCSTTHTSLVEMLLMLGAVPTSIAASHVRRAQSLEIEYIDM